MEVDYSQFEEKFGQGFQKYFKEDIPNLSQFVDEGFIEIKNERICLRLEGRLFIGNICSVFDTYFQKKKRNFSKAI